MADGDVVAQDGFALRDGTQRHLVPLRDLVFQYQTVGEDGAGRQAPIVRDDGDVIVVVHPDAAWRSGRF
jgi:hypothetical protein